MDKGCGVSIHTMKYYLSGRKDEILQFTATWRELAAMLSEVNQTVKYNAR